MLFPPLIDLVVAALGLLGLASLLLTLLTHRAALEVLGGRRSRRARARPGGGDAELPAISILKPLKGEDDELDENLASFAGQDYPRFEILLGAADPGDPALLAAERLRRRFPDVPIRVVKGAGHGRRAARNPKVDNLLQLEAQALHPWLLISDSNVRVRPDYLRRLAADATAQPGVALVHNLIGGQGEQTLGAALENAHLNSFVAASVAGADQLVGHPCVVGKSMLLRRDHLNTVGGLRGVEGVLAEDYVLGQRLHRAGFGVVLSSHAIATINRHWTLGRFFSRHLRWAQMRRRLCAPAYLCEPLLNPLAWVLALLWLRPVLAAWLAAGLLLKYASEVGLARALTGRRPTGLTVALLPIKDLLGLLIWVLGGLRRTVEWRGQRLRVGPGSILLPRGAEALEAALEVSDATVGLSEAGAARLVEGEL